MNFLVRTFKYCLMAPFFLYVFNSMAVAIDVYIPINVVTVFVIGFLRIFGFLMLVIFSLFIF